MSESKTVTLPDAEAFGRPPVETPHYGLDSGATGLTKREYFAALALQGLLARGIYAAEAAKEAVAFADELIEQLNTEEN